MHLTAPGRCLLAWDSGLGPSWDYDAETLNPKRAKRFASTEVWRSDSADGPGVSLGTTKAEAFMDWRAPDGRIVYYRAVATGQDGVRRQVGATERVEMPARRRRSGGQDAVPPCTPGGFKVGRGGAGNTLQLKPSVDVESGVLCYFVYDSNQDQPDLVVWVDSMDTESSDTHDIFLDRSGYANEGYVVRAVDKALNLSEPTDVVVPSGVLYLSDYYNHTLTTVDGTVAATYTGSSGVADHVDGTLAEARFDGPTGMALDADGNLYVADTMNHCIRKVAPDGTVSTHAGMPGVWGYYDFWPSNSLFNRPSQLAFDSLGQLWIGEIQNYLLRYIYARESGSTVNTPVGKPGWYGCIDGVGVADTIDIVGIAHGTPRICETASPHGFETGDLVRVYDSEPILVQIEGSSVANPTVITTRVPHGLGSSGTRIVTVSGHSGSTPSINGLRLATLTGPSTFTIPVNVTVAGTGGTAGFPGTNPYPEPNGRWTVTRIDATHFSFSTTLSGDGVDMVGGHCFLWDSDTPAGRHFSILDIPKGIAVLSNDDVYFTQLGDVVRRVRLSEEAWPELVTIAGTYFVPGSADGTGSAARFSDIGGIACDAHDELYVADRGNHTIRKVTTAGVVTTVLGVAGDPGNADGDVETARLNFPTRLCFVGEDLYIGEDGRNEDWDTWGVLRVFSGGVLTTLAGEPTAPLPAADGEGTAAHFLGIGGVACG